MSVMDASEENISRKEMLERIAALDHSQSQLRELNSEMRLWLEVSDEDMALLRSENTALRKQLKELEKMVTDEQQDEAEPCGLLSDSDLHENSRREKMIHLLEIESTTLREENKNLTAKLKNVEEERDEEKITMSRLRAAYQSLEVEMEEAQMERQQMNEIIHQKNLQLKHLEETVEEYSDTIKDLRMQKQELSEQLEERLDEASLAALTEVMIEDEGCVSPQLSLAEEIQMLVSATDVKTFMLDSTDVYPTTPEEEKDEENEAEELLGSPHLTADVTPNRDRFAGTLKTFCRVLCILSLLVLVFVALGTGFSISTLQSNTQCVLEPFIRVHYNTLPPI